MQALTLVHPKLSPAVCPQLGVASLAASVCERLAVDAPLTMLDAIQGVALTAVQQLVASQAFATAVGHVLEDAAAGVPALHVHAEGLHVRLTDIALRLRFVQACSTRLVTVEGGRDVGHGARQVGCLFFRFCCCCCCCWFLH